MIGQLLSGAMRVVSSLEDGQSERVLAEGMQKLGDEQSLQTRVVMLGWNRGDVATLLATILPGGISSEQCAQLIPTSSTPNEIEFGERCTLFAPKAGSYETASDLLDAIKLLGETQPDALKGVLASLPMDKASRPPSRLVIAPPIDVLASSPKAVSTLTENAAWLVVVANDKPPTAKELSVLSVISGEMLGLTVVGDNSATWSGKLGVPVKSPALTLSDVGGIQGLFLALAQDGSELRQNLSDWQRRGKLEDFLMVLQDELEQNKSSMERQRLLQNEQLTPNASQDRTLQDLQTRLRSMVSDGFDGVLHEVERRGLQSLQSGGAIDKVIRQLVNELEPENLDQTPTHDRIRLSLTPDKADVFGTVIKDAVSDHLGRDLGYSKSKSDDLMNEINRELKSQVKDAPHLRALGIHPTRFEGDVGMLGQLEVSYRGEMPKMTIGKRFSSARSWMMPAMMAAMLIGALITFFNVGSRSDTKNTIYVLMIPLLIGGFVWTFFSQKKNEEGHLSREIDRVRDGVSQQMRRVVNDMLRKEQQLLRDHFQKNGREITNQLGPIIRQEEQRRSEANRAGQQRTQRTMRTVEQKLRENQQSTMEVGRLLQMVQDLAPEIISSASSATARLN